MLLRQPRAVALVADLEAEHDHDVAGERLPQRDDDLVVGGEADLAMELEVGLAGLDPVLVRRLAPHPADELLEHREALRLPGEIGDGVGQREALERDAGLADPVDLQLVELDHPGAAMRGGDQDALRLQHLQRLAHRHAADREPPREIGLDQPLPGRHRARADGVDDGVGHLGGEALGPRQDQRRRRRRGDGVPADGRHGRFHLCRLNVYSHGSCGALQVWLYCRPSPGPRPARRRHISHGPPAANDAGIQTSEPGGKNGSQKLHPERRARLWRRRRRSPSPRRWPGRPTCRRRARARRSTTSRSAACCAPPRSASFPGCRRTPRGSGPQFSGPAWVLAEEYAKRLGVKLEIVPVSHETKVPILATGEADISIAPLSVTPKRLEVVGFRRLFELEPVLLRARRQSQAEGRQDASTTSTRPTSPWPISPARRPRPGRRRASRR